MKDNIKAGTPEEDIQATKRLLAEILDAMRSMDERLNILEDIVSGREKERAKKAQYDGILQGSILELNFSARTYNCLKNSGIRKIGDLVQYSAFDLMKLRNFGKGSLTEIEKTLAEKGLSLEIDI